MNAASRDLLASEHRALLPLPVLQAVGLYWLLLKGVTLFAGEPHADEAYYWLWGQHPSLSYFDHPGLHAWLQGLMAALFGWSLFGLRALTMLTTGVTLYVIWAWCRRLDPERSRYWFWLSVAVVFSSPVMLLYTTIAIQDRVLLALVLLSLHCFAMFFSDRADGRGGRLWLLYLAAALLGLAGLAKYTAALVALGVLAVVLVRGELRPFLKNPHLYLAALLAIAIQAPTLLWNAQQGFPSFRFHLIDRVVQTGEGSFDLGYTLAFLQESLVAISPVLLIPLWRILFRRAGLGFTGVLHSLAKWVLGVSSLALLSLSATRYVLFYWNVAGYAAAFVIAGWAIGSRWVLVAQLVYGLVLNTALIAHFTTFPVLQAIGIGQPQSAALFGWSEVAAAVRAAETANGAEFAAAPSWQTASKLAFALHRPDLPALTETTDAFDYWFDPAAFEGKDAIILAEPGDEGHIPYLGTLFQSVEPVGAIDIERFGRAIFQYRLYLGRSFHSSSE